MGSLSILGGGLLEWLIWLANPIYFIALVMLANNKRKAMYLSSFATIIALIFSRWTEILASESGQNSEISSFKSGYYLWVISIATLALTSVFYFPELDAKKNESKVM